MHNSLSRAVRCATFLRPGEADTVATVSEGKPVDEWYEIVSLRDDGGELLSEHDPKVWVRGKVGEITVIQLDLETVAASQQASAIQGISRLLDDAGIKKAVIMPQSVRFMRLRAATEEQVRALDDQADADTVVTRLH